MITTGLQPGIYFNLPAHVYHADPALSRSNIVALNDTPFTFWKQSGMNPDRVIKQSSEEMEFGDAFHYQLFEPHLFEKRYFVFPTEKWDSGRQMISKEDHDKIIDAIKVLRRGKDSHLFLSGGIGEVTIVFDAFGMRFRIRIDYQTPVCTVDFKTIYSLNLWAIKKHFEVFGYDVQLFLYKLGVRTFKEQFLAGEAHVYGNVDEKWFEKFLYYDQNEFIFIFQRKTEPYPFEPLAPEDDDEQNGMDKTLRAVELYKKNFQTFGTNPWEVSDGQVKRFSTRYGIIKGN